MNEKRCNHQWVGYDGGESNLMINPPIHQICVKCYVKRQGHSSITWTYNNEKAMYGGVLNVGKHGFRVKEYNGED